MKFAEEFVPINQAIMIVEIVDIIRLSADHDVTPRISTSEWVIHANL